MLYSIYLVIDYYNMIYFKPTVFFLMMVENYTFDSIYNLRMLFCFYS